jgi:hypothetical protein
MNQFWETAGRKGRLNVPTACLHGFPKLAVHRTGNQTVKVSVTIIVGDRDPCRRMYVEPLQKIRPGWLVYITADAGHLNCILKPDFKTQLAVVLGATPSSK